MSRDPLWYQATIKPGRVPEVGMQFCHCCRTGKRNANDPVYCGCSNKNCPYPVGMSNAEEKARG